MMFVVLFIIIHSCSCAWVLSSFTGVRNIESSLALPPAPLSLSECVIRIAERRVLYTGTVIGAVREALHWRSIPHHLSSLRYSVAERY